MTYEDLWSSVASVVVALGVGLSFVEWRPVPALVTLFVSVAGAGVLLCLALPVDRLTWAQVTAADVPARALWWGGSTVALVAFMFAGAPLVTALLLVAAGTCPWSLRRLDAMLRGHQKPQTPGRHDALGPAPVILPRLEAGAARELSNRELCHEWRRTFLALQSARCPARTLAVVAIRQLLLDEMERRDGRALAAWLSSGARAAGGPDRFLRDADR